MYKNNLLEFSVTISCSIFYCFYVQADNIKGHPQKNLCLYAEIFNGTSERDVIKMYYCKTRPLVK